MIRSLVAVTTLAAAGSSAAGACTDVRSCDVRRNIAGWASPPSVSVGKILGHRRHAAAQDGRLYLFDSLLQTRRDDASQRGGSTSNGIPQAELDFLGGGYGLLGGPSDATANGMPDLVNQLANEQKGTVPNAPPFPYAIDVLQTAANGGAKRQPSKLVIRHLEDDDIKKILPEVVREFGALAPSPSTTPEPGDEFAIKLENFLFSLTVLIGLTQRVARREKGYNGSAARPDHNVICLVEQVANESNGGMESSYKEQIVGIAELSLQPPNPNSNAPPFVLPYFMKELIARFSPSRDDSSPKSPMGYISNVLVWKTRRGRGYARILMAALEGIGKLWGCDDVRLHVDAAEFSGRIARGLYWSLGYEGVPDRGTSAKDQVGYGWMDSSMANQGLYLVDGVPLLYLRKSLKDD
ncbi:hypothetical protein ACHAXT_003004 [Thalassiosira profunda]